MARSSRLLIALLLVAVAALGLYAWRQRDRAETADRAAGIDATRVVAEVLREQQDLRVMQLAGTIIARTSYDGRLFHPTQETRAPATVNYFLDLRRIGRGDYQWDAATQRMTIRIPDVTVEAPAVDMAQAEVKQSGVWISRAAGAEMQRTAVRRIALRATERAKAPENMAAARRSAIRDMRALMQGPLRAAGFGAAQVEVLFPWEGGRDDGRRWDVSRDWREVYANTN